MLKPRIAVVMGSDSDWPVMSACVEQLRSFGEEAHVEVMSAHRGPRRVAEFATQAEPGGIEVIIAAAGMSNALAGAIAAHTCLPVIGVPLVSGSLNGLDALLSTAQMPPGIPVATMSLGEPGARNAGLLAVQIIARHDAKLAAAFKAFKEEQAKTVAAKNVALQERIRG